MQVEVHGKESNDSQERARPDRERRAMDEYRHGAEDATDDTHTGVGGSELALDLPSNLTVSDAVRDREEDEGCPQ